MIEVLRTLDAFDEDAVIIAAKPWNPLSLAQVVADSDGQVANLERDGLSYFLEIAIARDLKEDWPKATNRRFAHGLSPTQSMTLKRREDTWPIP